MVPSLIPASGPRLDQRITQFVQGAAESLLGLCRDNPVSLTCHIHRGRSLARRGDEGGPGQVLYPPQVGPAVGQLRHALGSFLECGRNILGNGPGDLASRNPTMSAKCLPLFQRLKKLDRLDAPNKIRGPIGELLQHKQIAWNDGCTDYDVTVGQDLQYRSNFRRRRDISVGRPRHHAPRPLMRNCSSPS